MHPDFKIGMVGTGALGAYYGARLVHAGYDVQFVLHNDYEHVLQHGLKVESIHGDFSVAHPQIVAQVSVLEPCDVLCLSLKSTANAQVMSQLKSVLKPHGVVLVLQNGLGIEEEVQQHTQSDVLGGLCFLCSNKVGPGHIRHLDYGDIRLGALENTPNALQWLDRLQQAFVQAGIGIHRAKDLRQARWQKLVWNIPFNGLSVVLQADTQQMMQHYATRALVQGIMDEVAHAAACDGHPLPAGFVERMMLDTDKMTPYLPSMRLDADRGNPLEIEAIYSAPLRMAERVGCAMPRTQMLRDQLQFLFHFPLKHLGE